MHSFLPVVFSTQRKTTPQSINLVIDLNKDSSLVIWERQETLVMKFILPMSVDKKKVIL